MTEDTEYGALETVRTSVRSVIAEVRRVGRNQSVQYSTYLPSDSSYERWVRAHSATSHILTG